MYLKSDKPRAQHRLEFCAAQLRHAYAQLCVGAPLCPDGYWSEARRQQFARGLLGPVIERLEQALREMDEPPSVDAVAPGTSMKSWTFGSDGASGCFFVPEVGAADSPHGLGIVHEADARLIAAAPDLLVALKNLVEFSECSKSDAFVWRAARATIRKAEAGFMGGGASPAPQE